MFQQRGHFSPSATVTAAVISSPSPSTNCTEATMNSSSKTDGSKEPAVATRAAGAVTVSDASWLLPMIFSFRASSSALVTTSRTAIISSMVATCAPASAGRAGTKSRAVGQPASCTEASRPSMSLKAGG